jgi:hypothetical protein
VQRSTDTTSCTWVSTCLLQRNVLAASSSYLIWLSPPSLGSPADEQLRDSRGSSR